jgi:hypothetical protein
MLLICLQTGRGKNKMKRLIGAAARGLNQAAKSGVNKAKIAATDPTTRGKIVETVTNTISADAARNLAEKTVGKKTTDKVVTTCGKAYTKVDKTLGKGRLKGAAQSAVTAALTTRNPWAIGAAAAAGYVTKQDIATTVAETVFGKDEAKDTSPKEPASAPASKKPSGP